jgi:hypothetical protein
VTGDMTTPHRFTDVRDLEAEADGNVQGADHVPLRAVRHSPDRATDLEEMESGASPPRAASPFESELPLPAASQDTLEHTRQADEEPERFQRVMTELEVDQQDVEDKLVDSDAESSSDEMQELCLTPDYAQLYMDNHPYQYSRAALVARAYAHARQLGWIALEADKFRQIGTEILCSMPDLILRALVAGNLAQVQRDDEWGCYGENSALLGRGEHEVPCVYAVFVVSSDGGHVPQEQLRKVAEVLRRYVRTTSDPNDPCIDEAVAVDNAYRTPSVQPTQRKHIRAGRHRFLWQVNRKRTGGKRKRGPITVIEQFCKAVEHVCEQEEGRTLPLHYIGYAHCFAKRTPAHAKGSGSSFLLQLVKHVLQMLYPGEYSLEAFPIFFACDAERTRIGEQLLTLVGHGLAHSGQGLGIHPAGINNASANMSHRSAEEEKKIWTACKEFREGLPWFMNGVREELAHLASIKAERDEDARAMQEELESLQQEIETAEGVFETEYGEGLADRLQANLEDAYAELDVLAEQEGDAAQPLVDRLRDDTDADRAVVLGSWKKWKADMKMTGA